MLNSGLDDNSVGDRDGLVGGTGARRGFSPKLDFKASGVSFSLDPRRGSSARKPGGIGGGGPCGGDVKGAETLSLSDLPPLMNRSNCLVESGLRKSLPCKEAGPANPVRRSESSPFAPGFCASNRAWI